MGSFDEQLEMVSVGEGRFEGRISADWVQGRTVFGGLAAALVLRAMRRTLPVDRRLASISVAFVAPLEAGVVDVSAEIMRSGKYVTHTSGTIGTGGEIAARVHAVFGDRRPGSIAVARPSCRPSKPIEQGLPFPFMRGMSPEFTQHFDYCLTEGDVPFQGTSRATMGGFIRHQTAASGVEAILGLIDAWPSPVLPLRRGMFPASTVSWSVHMLDDPPDGFDGHYWFRDECVTAADGYATTVGHIHAGDVAVAWSEQLVAYFER